MNFRYIPNFFALGFGVELVNTSEGFLYWRALSIKLFLGFWTCFWIIRMSKKRKLL